jgi:DNA-binding response OmpR family regulator
MSNRLRAIAFDVDPDTLATLQQGFPGWEIEVRNGSSTGSLDRDWNPATADLLVVGTGGELSVTLGLCRGLRSQVGRALTPLLVLVPPAQEALVKAALDAGATGCLVLPVHAKELTSSMSRAQGGNRPGRHTLSLDRAQQDDRWRDDGGEA